MSEIAIKDLPRRTTVLSDGDVLVFDNGTITYAITILNFISNYLRNSIDVPTKTSDLQNDSGFLTSHQQVDAALSRSSANPVQNKVVKAALDDMLVTLPQQISTQLGVNVLKNIAFSVNDGVMTVTKTYYNGTTQTENVTLFTDGDEIPV